LPPPPPQKVLIEKEKKTYEFIEPFKKRFDIEKYLT